MRKFLLFMLLIGTVTTGAGAAQLDEIAIAKAGFAAEAVGFVLADLDSGAVLAERSADRPFVPASTAKLPTMAAALGVLGPGHRFATTLRATGRVEGGALRGDLILVGGGDPSLTTDDLRALAATLRTAGVTRVSGRFLYDTTALPDLPEIDPAQPWAAGYNTGVAALAINYNRALLTWNAGGRPRVWTVADGGRLPLDSMAIETGGGPAGPVIPASGAGDAAGERWRLAAPSTGAVSGVWLPVTRPGPAAASVFRRVAVEAGIALPAPRPGRAPADATLVARHDSAPLAELARAVLRYSNNLSAEMIGLGAARRLEPSVGTLARSAAVLSAWSVRHGPPTDWRALRLLNHSGLTSASRVTPAEMVALLRGAGPALWDLLPGADDGKALPPGVFAKSGTMAYARGLTGVLTTTSGRRLGFALFIGDEARRRALDATLDRSSAALPPEARAWLVRARALEADILADWIARY